MEHSEEAGASMLSYDAKAYPSGVILHLLVYNSPILENAVRDDPGLRIQVYLNPFDIGRAYGLLPDGSHIDLYVSRPDYACGRSLANHMQNMARLNRHAKSARDGQAGFEVPPIDPDDEARAAKVVMPPELKGRRRKSTLAQLHKVYLDTVALSERIRGPS